MDANRFIRAVCEFREIFNFRKNFKIIKNVLSEPSLYSDKPRKSYHRRLYENLRWYILHGEPNRYYNSYGFDIVGFRNQKDYIPYRRFRIERNNENYRVSPFHPYNNQTLILRDKILFSSFFGQLLGNRYVIESLGYIQTDGQVYNLRTHQYTTLADMVQTYPVDLFIKKLFGECGDGCYVLNKQTNNIGSLVDTMRGSKYIIQPRLEQHPDLSRLNSSCINTIRIITIWGKHSHKAAVLSHYVRFGINSINDNRATGGFSVSIDSEGRLGTWGIGHHYRTDKHPVTGLFFKGTQIPYFEQIRQLVTAAHALIPQVISIGWDVAITPQGPVLLEGNDNWEMSGPQDVFGGLKKTWYKLNSL